MSDKNVSLIPDVIKSSSDAIQANIPKTAEQTDGALSTVVGFFNKVVLYPVKKANLTFQYKLEAFEEDLKKKILDIPDENLQVPPTMIAGPTLEALRYTYDEKELREMYENLLASAMDNRKVSHAHPAFVDAIKQMSSLDAKVMSIIAVKRQLRCANIALVIRVYAHGMPARFVIELLELGDPFELSTSITNLERLGLIDIYDRGLTNSNYEELKNHTYVEKRKAFFAAHGEEIETHLGKQAIILNDYGRQFAQICLG